MNFVGLPTWQNNSFAQALKTNGVIAHTIGISSGNVVKVDPDALGTLFGAAIWFDTTLRTGFSLDFTDTLSLRIGAGFPYGFEAAIFSLQNGAVAAWSSTSNFFGSKDTGISRISAGVLGMGTGAQGSFGAAVCLTAMWLGAVGNNGLTIDFANTISVRLNTGFNFGFEPTLFSLQSGAAAVWSSTANFFGAKDTGLSRVSAGVVGVGNGAVGDITGKVSAGSYAVGGNNGIDASITSASLVGKTITVTKGIVTGFA